MIAQALKSVLAVTPIGVCGHGWSPVLTYHTCYKTVPADLDPIDNVPPERLYDHVAALKKRFRVVPIDEYCRARDRRGIAAITFDDGNKSAIETAAPILLDLGLPFTVFINTLGMERRLFWRLKVLYVMRRNLTAACEASFSEVRKLPGKSFHQYTKDSRNNSIVVEREIDRFLQQRGLDPGKLDYLFDDRSYLIGHPLTSFGNHTASHYVLGSLTREQQHAEISAVREYLAKAPGVNVSEVFAAPFGEEQHLNDETFQVLRDLGYRYLLVNRGGVNRSIRMRCGVGTVERFSALDEDIEWQLKRQAVRFMRPFSPADGNLI